jgi:hypothetical protein
VAVPARALTLFGMYIRSGDVAWLRHAHRAAQFYGAHLGADGTFDLAAGDLKYAYGSALFLDLMLTGDTRHLPRIAAVARAGAGWAETYTARTGFWTERHQTYALLAALVAWEATGEAGHATRARAPSWPRPRARPASRCRAGRPRAASSTPKTRTRATASPTPSARRG